MLEPSYGEGVGRELDKIEADDARKPLWSAIVDTLNLICDQPDNPQARRYAIRTPQGSTIWRVPIRVTTEDHDWCVLWSPEGGDAAITYVGPWPPISGSR